MKRSLILQQNFQPMDGSCSAAEDILIWVKLKFKIYTLACRTNSNFLKSRKEI